MIARAHIVAALFAGLLAFQEAGAGADDAEALAATLDLHVERGFDQPAAALAELAALSRQPPAGSGRTRMFLLARGLIAAGASDGAVITEVLTALGRMDDDPLARADAELVRATQGDSQGEAEAVVKAAAAALEVYHQRCPATPGCDYRSSFRALYLLSRYEARRGQSHAAQEDAQAALQIAGAAGDRRREALARALEADAWGEQGEETQAQRLLESALQGAQASHSLATESRVQALLVADAERRNDLAAAYRAGEVALALAKSSGSPRLLAIQQANMADIAVKTGRAGDALRLAGMALPVARRFGDRRIELIALHNMALAQVALGQEAAARKVLDELLAVHHRTGALGMEAEALREFGDAFARVGNLRGALDLFHRERALTAEILAANRDAVLSQLRAHYDSEAQQRQLTRLERQDALINVQLENRRANQSVWIGSGLLLLLVVILLVLLYRRVRELNRRLESNQGVLRAQSQVDPLTGLANRRRLQDAGPDAFDVAAFHGALLLVDVDHFKRINDQRGHATGDQVLVELAGRLSALMRPQDLVVRWGGEEFLILLPGSALPLARELAERVLHAVGSQIVALPDGSLRVTVSVGYAAFPLPPQLHRISLERAINLADMALITAKREGRNRAIGIETINADDPAELQRAGADFDLAVQQGMVGLRKSNGPAPSLAVVGASAA